MRLREKALETYLIVKTSLSAVWFWIPVLFALYIPFQMYLMFINPLLLAIAPVALVVYLTYEEERGFRAKYQLDGAYEKTEGTRLLGHRTVHNRIEKQKSRQKVTRPSSALFQNAYVDAGLKALLSVSLRKPWWGLLA